jgi:FMN phosphatase YigB (HAD superfamily)
LTLILFDLDDTLLGNEMNDFIPAYLQSLAKRMAGVADPTILIKTLLSATHRMIENLDPGCTLEDCFDATFYPALGLLRQNVQCYIDSFYEEDFPKLQSLTRFLPDSKVVVEHTLAQYNQVAIATNPLFPRTAILQRLSWAGFPDAQEKFSLIPSYETFHFAKPNPAFYAEFLARLGWPDIPVVMVGNDADMDITPAQEMGITTYWVTTEGAGPWHGKGEFHPHGKISEFIPWLHDTTLKPMHYSFSTIDSLVAVLNSTPAALAAMHRNENRFCHDHSYQVNPPIDELLDHLIEIEIEVILPELSNIIDGPRNKSNYQRQYKSSNTDESPLQEELGKLRKFSRARIAVIKLLLGVPEENWRSGTKHRRPGSDHILDFINSIAAHDITHMQQLYKSLNYSQ